MNGHVEMLRPGPDGAESTQARVQCPCGPSAVDFLARTEVTAPTPDESSG